MTANGASMAHGNHRTPGTAGLDKGMMNLHPIRKANPAEMSEASRTLPSENFADNIKRLTRASGVAVADHGYPL